MTEPRRHWLWTIVIVGIALALATLALLASIAGAFTVCEETSTYNGDLCDTGVSVLAFIPPVAILLSALITWLRRTYTALIVGVAIAFLVTVVIWELPGLFPD